MYLKTVSAEEATGEIAELYRPSLEGHGFVMEADACWTAVPGLFPMVEHLLQTSRANFTLGLRNWRLITLVAAKEVPSTYCSLVYAKLLADDIGKGQVLAIQRDFRNAGLSDKDVAMLAYAEQVARNASKITLKDIEALRQHGFNDVEIGEIAFCASFRSFLSRYFDAVGATPEPVFVDPDAAFREAMTVGKPIAASV
jgi:alkylhydroperoxidase family enzyme